MIIKHFNLKAYLDKKISFYLLYGQNIGLIEETIKNIIKPKFSNNIYYYDETEILADEDGFKERIYNKSFFENDKLIIINRGTDKIFDVINELTEKKIKISIQNINFIIDRSKGNRILLKNELNKIASYSKNYKTIEFNDILKLTSS